MNVNPVNTATQLKSNVSGTVATQAAQAKRADAVELSNRNPANKKELMATYAKLRTQQPELQKQAILNAFTGQTNTIAAPQVPNLQTAVTAPAAKTTATTPGNTGNVIRGPEGFASANNRVTVNGANNTVDLAGSARAGTTAQTFAATGGPAITNANVNVTGGNNAVKFNGGMQDNATVNINGNANKVNVGNNVDNANLNIAGNNVTVNIADNNALTKNQNNWNINVNANDVNITIENGEATVTGANGNQNFKVEIDNTNRSVTVTKLPEQNAGGLTPPVTGEDLGV